MRPKLLRRSKVSTVQDTLSPQDKREMEKIKAYMLKYKELKDLRKQLDTKINTLKEQLKPLVEAKGVYSDSNTQLSFGTLRAVYTHSTKPALDHQLAQDLCVKMKLPLDSFTDAFFSERKFALLVTENAFTKSQLASVMTTKTTMQFSVKDDADESEE